MHLSLEVKARQQLSISPQLQQAIRLLQLSSVELQAEIDQITERNPLLELEEPSQIQITEPLPSLNRMTTSSVKRLTHDEDLANDPYYNTKAFETLSDHLLAQLNLLDLSEHQIHIAHTIIDALNSDGYLHTRNADIAQQLTQQQIPTTERDIEPMLALIQSFDPPGIGARTVPECILLQLARHHHHDTTIRHAQIIVEQCFDLLSKKDYKKICRQLNMDQATFLQALEVITHVNPRPGANFTQLPQHYIVPDVFVRRHQGNWQVYLNPNSNPAPRINKHYLALLSKAKNERDTQFIKDNLKEAKWFINSIENRHSTLLKVAKAIMEVQMGFLEQGEMGMQPLRLLTIADAVELHESTISRITTQKYIDTPHGIYELKHFFSSQLQSDSGDACSSTAIKALIKKMIDCESKEKPLSDNLIAKQLKSDGINIARRTVTKYREAMGILSSTDRKQSGF